MGTDFGVSMGTSMILCVLNKKKKPYRVGRRPSDKLPQKSPNIFEEDINIRGLAPF